MSFGVQALAPSPSTLTRRQDQVARMVALGLSDREIACELGCRDATVWKHILKAKRALGVETRSDLIREWRRQRVETAARTMHERSPSLSVAAWRHIVLQVLNAVDGR